MSIYSEFEWYYFDLHTDDGYDLVCTIHTAPFNSVFNIAIFDIFIYHKKEEVVHYFYVLPKSDLQKYAHPFLLQYDPLNFIKRDGKSIEVNMKDEQIHLYLTMEDVVQKPNHSVNQLIDKPKNGNFEWIVYAPFCEAQADIVFGNKTWSLKGRGYHDYNRGDANLKKELKQWVWAKYIEKDFMLVYGDIITRKNESKKIAVAIHSEQVEIDQNPVYKEEDGQQVIRFKEREYRYFFSDSYTVDHVRFYMSSWPQSLKFFVKIIEAGIHFTSRMPLINRLTNLFRTVSYKRVKSVGKNSNGQPVVRFNEEMYL